MVSCDENLRSRKRNRKAFTLTLVILGALTSRSRYHAADGFVSVSRNGPLRGSIACPLVRLQASNSVADVAENKKSILREITAAKTPVDILAVLEHHSMDTRQGFNFVCASAAFHSLAKKRDDFSEDIKQSSTLKSLAKSVKSMLARGETHVGTLAVMIWALAALRRDVPELIPDIMPDLVDDALTHEDWLAKGHLARVMWSIASLKDQAPEMRKLVAPLLATAPDRIADMRAHNVANMLWAIATLKDDEPELQSLLPALCDRTREVQGDLTKQNAGNILWATGKLAERASCLKTLLPDLARIACPEGVGLDDASRGGVGGGYANLDQYISND